MSDFTVFPAIDLRGGKVVRLRQGDPDQQTVYSDNPAETAQQFLDAGAEMVHVINLDGAFSEAQDASLEAVRAVLETGARGAARRGIRSLETIEPAWTWEWRVLSSALWWSPSPSWSPGD